MEFMPVLHLGVPIILLLGSTLSTVTNSYICTQPVVATDLERQ